MLAKLKWEEIHGLQCLSTKPGKWLIYRSKQDREPIEEYKGTKKSLELRCLELYNSFAE